MFHGQPGESLTALQEEVAEAGAKYADFYIRHRRKRDVQKFQEMIDGWVAALKEIGKKASSSWLKVIFALPDGYGAERIKITVDGQQIASGVLKHGNDAFYEIFFCLPADITAPNTVTIEACGYAGQGVAYVCAKTGKNKFIPDGIVGTAGIAEHPEHVLHPNVNFAFLGRQNTLNSFHDRNLAEAVHSITVSLKKGK